MKKIFALLSLLSLTCIAADVKMGDLPLGVGSATGANDSFPYVDSLANASLRLKLYDIVNVPTIASALASKQNNLTFGSVTTATTGVTISSGASSTVGPTVGVNVQTSSNSQPGLLSAADHTSFAGAATATTAATSSNTASTIVKRDSSGNFSAGTISAALSGNSTTATALAADPTDCADSSNFANSIDANGNLTCSTVTVAKIVGTIGPTRGGTGITTYSTGDVLYADSSNHLAKLSGNTTTTPKALVQTGDGVNSAAPAWTAVGSGTVTSVGIAVPSELGTVSSSPVTTSGTLTLTRNSANAQSADYVITSTDNVINVTTSTSTINITLPTAASISGRSYTINKVDSAVGSVAIKTTSGQTVGGIASNVIKMGKLGDSITVVSDGSNWSITNWGFFVGVKYQNTAGTTISAIATIPFATKVYDTYSAFSSGVFTAPFYGEYEICYNVFAAPSLSATQYMLGYVLVTSTPEGTSAQADLSSAQFGASTAQNHAINLCRTYQLNGGDTLAAQVSSDVSTTLSASAGRNVITVTRIGN